MLMAQLKTLADKESWMPDKVTAHLRKLLRKTGGGHDIHAPFRVTLTAGIPCKRLNLSNWLQLCAKKGQWYWIRSALWLYHQRLTPRM